LCRIKFWSENLKGRDHAKYLAIDGKILLKWIFGNRVGKCGLDASSSGQGPVACCCEDGNELSGSIKGWEFLHLMSDSFLASQEGLCYMESVC